MSSKTNLDMMEVIEKQQKNEDNKEETKKWSRREKKKGKKGRGKGRDVCLMDEGKGKRNVWWVKEKEMQALQTVNVNNPGP